MTLNLAIGLSLPINQLVIAESAPADEDAIELENQSGRMLLESDAGLVQLET